MGWDGDLSAMGQLANRVADLARVPSRAARHVAGDLEDLIETTEFDAGADPYGEAWKPLADATLARGRTEPPLTDTGEMRRSLKVKPMQRAGVSLTIDHPAAPHQTGWSGPVGDGPARPILPYGEMPSLWRELIDAAVDTEVRHVG